MHHSLFAVVLLSLSLLPACGNPPAGPDTSDVPAQPTQQGEKRALPERSRTMPQGADDATMANSAPSAMEQEAIKKQLTASYEKMLTGEWQLENDKSTRIKIGDNRITFITKGQAAPEESFEINIECGSVSRCSTNGKPAASGTCLLTASNCYVLKRLTQKDILIHQAGQTTTSKYIRVQN